MNYINQAVCLTKNGYKGQGTCTTSPGVAVGYLLLPKGTIVTATNVASLYTYLLAAATNNNPALRIFNFPKIRGVVDQSKQKKTSEFPDQSTVDVSPMIPRWQFQFYNGLCDHKQNRVFQEQQQVYDYMQYDATGLLLGKLAFDAAGNYAGQQGWDLSEISVPGWSAATNSDPAKFYMEIQLSGEKQMNENLSMIQVNDFDLSTIPGIQEVSLSVLGTALTSGVVTLTALTGCAGGNLAQSAIGANLAVAGAWSAVNTATGAALTISSVALNAAGTGYIFTFATTSPYPTTGGQITIKLASVSALVALGVKYYESPNGITLTV